MTKKTLILGNLILIFLLLYWFNFSQEKPVIKEQKEITIFTLDPLITIHAKMISGNNDEIKNTSNKKLTKLDIAHVESADIVFGGKTFETSSLQKIEKYRNHYVTIPLIVESPNSTYSLIELQTQIETIRDALAEKNPDRRGQYFDNAGNYIHLLDTTLVSFKARISKYHQTPFITVGNGLDNFLQALEIDKNRVKHFTSFAKFTSDKEVGDLIENKNIRSVFVTETLSDSEERKYEEKYNVVIYQTPSLEKDMSQWGYVRFIEKIMNNFVAAFDTYD